MKYSFSFGDQVSLHYLSKGVLIADTYCCLRAYNKCIAEAVGALSRNAPDYSYNIVNELKHRPDLLDCFTYFLINDCLFINSHTSFSSRDLECPEVSRVSFYFEKQRNYNPASSITTSIGVFAINFDLNDYAKSLFISISELAESSSLFQFLISSRLIDYPSCLSWYFSSTSCSLINRRSPKHTLESSRLLHPLNNSPSIRSGKPAKLNDVLMLLESIFLASKSAHISDDGAEYYQASYPSAGGLCSCLPIVFDSASNYIYIFDISSNSFTHLEVNDRHLHDSVFSEFSLNWASNNHPSVALVICSSLKKIIPRYHDLAFKLAFQESGLLLGKIHSKLPSHSLGGCIAGNLQLLHPFCCSALASYQLLPLNGYGFFSI